LSGEACPSNQTFETKEFPSAPGGFSFVSFFRKLTKQKIKYPVKSRQSCLPAYLSGGSNKKIKPLAALAVQKIIAPEDLSASGGWYRGG